MSWAEKFGLFTSLVGLVVDSAALIGFALGVIELSPSLGFWSNPIVVAVVTFTFLSFSLVAGLFFIIQYAKNRWKAREASPKLDESGMPSGKIMGWFLWLPTSILWGIGISRYSWTYFGEALPTINTSNSGLDSLLYPLFFIYFLLVPAFGGVLLPYIVIELDEFFEPSGFFSKR